MADGLTKQPDLGLRPVEEGDRDFLRAVYASTRADELAAVPWSADERTTFVAMQFDAQDAYYRQVYPAGEFLVVLSDGVPVGRLYLARLDDEIRIVDLALLPEQRGRGIGSRLLSEILASADAAGLAVRLHVEPWNPAKRLYERLGFGAIAEAGIYLLMERPARDRAAIS